MQIKQDGLNMFMLACPSNKTCSSVLNPLEFDYVGAIYVVQERISIVQLRRNQRVGKCFACRVREKVPNASYFPNL